MNRMIALVNLLCVLQMVKIWHFSGKFDQHLSLYCGCVKQKFKTVLGYWFLWESCELRFQKFTDKFSFFKYTFKRSSNFLSHWNNMEKMARSICLNPVSLKTWRLHTLWRFTVLAYYFNHETPVCTISAYILYKTISVVSIYFGELGRLTGKTRTWNS